MKVTKQDLRRIIREAVQRKLDEAGEHVDVASELAPYVARAVTAGFNPKMGTVAAGMTPPDVTVPVRYEDVEPLAEQITEQVMKDNHLRSRIQDVARAMLHELMEPT